MEEIEDEVILDRKCGTHRFGVCKYYIGRLWVKSGSAGCGSDNG